MRHLPSCSWWDLNPKGGFILWGSPHSLQPSRTEGTRIGVLLWKGKCLKLAPSPHTCSCRNAFGILPFVLVLELLAGQPFVFLQAWISSENTKYQRSLNIKYKTPDAFQTEVGFVSQHEIKKTLVFTISGQVSYI